MTLRGALCLALFAVCCLEGCALCAQGQGLVLEADFLAGAQAKRDATRAPVKTFVMRSAASEPKIDGVLNDPCWQGAALPGDFVSIRSVAERAARERNAKVVDKRLYWDRFLREAFAPTEKTRAWLTYDAKNVYVAFECLESRMAKVRTSAEQFRFSHDCVEIFLDPRHDWKTYYHLGVNPSGKLYDAFGRNLAKKVKSRGTRQEDPQWQSHATVAVAKGDSSWTMEVALPLKTIGVTSMTPGNTWSFNLGREHPVKKEYSTWAPVLNGFCEPDSFGDLILEHLPQYSLERVALNRPGWGKNTISAEVLGKEDAPPAVLDVILEVIAPSGKSARFKTSLKASRGRNPFSIEYAIHETGKHQLNLALLLRGDPPRVLATKNYFSGVCGKFLSFSLSRNRFFSSDRLARATVGLHIGAGVVPQLALALKLLKKGCAQPLATETIQPLKSRNAEITLNIANCRAGEYGVRAELVLNGKVIASQEKPFTKVRGVFDL